MRQTIDVRASIADVRELVTLMRDLCEVAKEAAPLLQGFRQMPTPTPSPTLLFPGISDTNGSHPVAVEKELVNGFDPQK